MASLDIDREEIKYSILNLRNDCAVNWNGIHTIILKQAYPVLVPPLTHICNLSLKQGVFPDAFKQAIFNPIHKNRANDFVNYHRPISGLSTISKSLEKFSTNDYQIT